MHHHQRRIVKADVSYGCVSKPATFINTYNLITNFFPFIVIVPLI